MCCGNAVSITYSECVFVAFVIQHAVRMRHIVFSKEIFHIGSQTARLPKKKKNTEHKICVLIFSTTFI
jgi:hypothetical protein